MRLSGRQLPQQQLLLWRPGSRQAAGRARGTEKGWSEQLENGGGGEISRFDRGGRGLDPIAEEVREEVNGTLYGKGTGGYRGGWPSGSHPK